MLFAKLQHTKNTTKTGFVLQVGAGRVTGSWQCEDTETDMPLAKATVTEIKKA